MPAGGAVIVPTGAFARRALRSRQIKLHSRAVTLFAIDLDVPVRLLDETVDHAEAKT